MQAISSKPAPDGREENRKAVCRIRGQFLRPPPSSVKPFSVRYVGASKSEMVSSLYGLFLPPNIEPLGSLDMEYLAIINSPKNGPPVQLTDPDVLEHLSISVAKAVTALTMLIDVCSPKVKWPTPRSDD